MAYTLADFSALAETPLKKAVIDVFRRESMLLDLLSFETTGTLSTEMIRTKTLPTITARNIGEAFTVTKGYTEPIRENVSFLGCYIDIPKELVQAKNQITNQRTLQSDMMITSNAYKYNDMFINGNPVTNPKEMVGLWWRVINDLAGSQNIDAASGSGLDVSPDASGLTANLNTLVDKLDSLEHAVEGHKADYFIMNSTMYLRLLSAARQLDMLSTTTDQMGRKFKTWGDVKLIDLGVKSDQSTKIIGDVELTNGSALTGGSATSIYAIRLGGNFLNAWQFAPVDVVDKGLLEDHVSYRTVVDWSCGLYFYNPRSFARLYGIIAA